jgi:hypothetical protein
MIVPAGLGLAAAVAVLRRVAVARLTARPARRRLRPGALAEPGPEREGRGGRSFFRDGRGSFYKIRDLPRLAPGLGDDRFDRARDEPGEDGVTARLFRFFRRPLHTQSFRAAVGARASRT